MGGEESRSRRSFIRSAGAAAVAGVALPLLGKTLPNDPKDGTEGKGGPESRRSHYTGEEVEPQAAADAFSIFWITDTQFLSESNPALYRMVTNWIVDHWEEYNGRLVIHTGDLVEDGENVSEWQNADAAMSVLLKNGIPYTWCAGNHDDLSLGDATSGWIGSQSAPSLDPSAVGPQVDALGYAGWAGDYHQGMNTALTFSASGLDFLVVNVEWNAQPDVLAWLQGVLEDPQYEGYHVIVAPHAYIDPFGSLNDPTWGAELAKFIGGLTPILDANSSSVFLTLNGHFASECGYNTPRMVNGRNELMFDRQDCIDEPGESTGRGADDDTTPDLERVGGATIGILTFAPSTNEIGVRMFDLFRGEWRDGPTESYEIQMFPDAQAATSASATVVGNHTGGPVAPPNLMVRP